MSARISVIICLYDPGQFLRTQIDALSRQNVPPSIEWEVIYVDNSPDGRHRKTVDAVAPAERNFRYLRQPTPGKCQSANLGVALAQGDVLVFSDDDILPPEDWIASIAGPIISGEGDVATGAIRTPPHLQREWMSDIHRTIFMDGIPPDPSSGGVHGANFAVRRSCFEEAGGFDPELGPGRLGAGEDSLIGLQFQKLGCRFVAAAEGATVEHHFQPLRLTRKAFLRYAAAASKSQAYIDYHWWHKDINFSMSRIVRSLFGLMYVRLKPWMWRHKEGMCSAEHYQIIQINYQVQLFIEKKRSPNYRLGQITKHVGELPLVVPAQRGEL